MKYLLILIVLVSCKGESQAITDDTVYYLIRHAEKERGDNSNNNPNLTDAGKERAQQWKMLLQDKGIDLIYSTDYNRTLQTAQPLAEKLDLTVQVYDPTDLNNEEFKASTINNTTLIVGHSNTTPYFVNAIIGEDNYSDLDDNNNGALFKITFKNGKANVNLQQFE